MRTELKVIVACLALAGLFLPASQANAMTSGQAKRAASETVRASASYQEMASPYRLKVSSCRANSKRGTTCRLYRSAPSPCALGGPQEPDQVCVNTVAYRAWTVRVTASGKNASAKVVAQRDVIGKFEPSS
ncbi:MAG: hypothetical protein WDZ37_07610 [Solirubrobacterales bacterium]